MKGEGLVSPSLQVVADEGVLAAGELRKHSAQLRAPEEEAGGRPARQRAQVWPPEGRRAFCFVQEQEGEAKKAAVHDI